MSPPILEARALEKSFPLVRGWLRRRHATVRAVDQVSFTVEARRTVAIGSLGPEPVSPRAIGESTERARTKGASGASNLRRSVAIRAVRFSS